MTEEERRLKDTLDTARRSYENTRFGLWFTRVTLVVFMVFVALWSKDVGVVLLNLFLSSCLYVVVSRANRSAKLEHQEAAQSYLYWMVRGD